MSDFKWYSIYLWELRKNWYNAFKIIDRFCGAGGFPIDTNTWY